MLVTAYNFSLNHSLPQGLVTINKFDGSSPALASSTTGGKILVHTPHSKDEMDPVLGLKGKDIQYLNVNKDVVCLSGGQLNPTLDRELLMIGSKTNLLVYDVNENSDVFDKEVEDGINCMLFAKDFNATSPLVLTGGNLSLTGFDISSDDQFWTVTGDVANTMEILDFDLDQEKELLVGSDDYSIRVYKGEELIFDINEESKIQFLSKIQNTAFAYALNNGSLGVYSGSQQKWSKRVDNKISALLGVDYDMDGSYQLMVGYQNGKVEVRKSIDGEVIQTTNMDSTISKIAYEDYRLEGTPQVVIWNTDGDIKGFNITNNAAAFETNNAGIKQTNEAINKINKEIMQLKANLDTDNFQKKEADAKNLASVVPSDFKWSIIQATVDESACLIFEVNSSLVLRSVLLFSDILFENGSYVSCPIKGTSSITVPISPSKSVEWEVDCKIIVGKSVSAEDFMTLHETVVFKKFSLFKNIEFSKDYSDGKAPVNVVSYRMKERPNRVLLWAQKVFNLNTSQDGYVINKSDSLDVMFLHVKSQKQLIIQARIESSGMMLQISHDDLETIGDMVQDMWVFMSIDELEPENIEWPFDVEQATELIQNIGEYDKLRGHFSANIAESVNNAKAFVVKGEFSLMLGDMASVKKNYTVVQQENGSLIGEYLQRRNNHEELVKSLKELNNFIRKSSNLRLGPSKGFIGKSTPLIV